MVQQFLYIPPVQFSFFIILTISSLPEPIVEKLEFCFIKVCLPILSEGLPFIHQQLDNYFLNNSQKLNIPYQLKAKTKFQQHVLTTVQQIPFGKFVTYGDMAKKLNTHPRAIGQALKSNPLPLIYPCHRVTSKAGLGGFMGQAKGDCCDIKLVLLKLEIDEFKIERA